MKIKLLVRIYLLYFLISCNRINNQNIDYINFSDKDFPIGEYNSNESKIDSLISVCEKIDSSAKDTLSFKKIGSRFFYLSLTNTEDTTFKIFNWRLYDSTNDFGNKLTHQAFFIDNQVSLILMNNFDSPKHEMTKWNWETIIVQNDSLLCIAYQKLGYHPRLIKIPEKKDHIRYRNLIYKIQYQRTAIND